MKELDTEFEKIFSDNLWKLYDDIEDRMKKADELLKEVDEVLKNDEQSPN